MKKNNFIVNVLIIGLAVFSLASLLLFRIKVSQLIKEQETLESQIASYSDRITEIEELIDTKH